MMRIYQGVDIVEISKFREIASRNNAFLTDIFTDQERAYCQSMKDPTLHFAGRFAAKESYLKALGMGLSGGGIDRIFQEIEVTPTGSGRPEITVSGWAEKMARKRKVRQASVSISHASQYAVATVILVGNG